MYCFKCDKCGNTVNMDESRTLTAFLSKVDYIKDDVDKICDIALKSYLMYRCTFCDTSYKYTIAEVEQKIREKISYEVKQVRKAYVLRHDVILGSVNPDNGLEFCGRCVGIDDEGNCYKDIIKQCSFRR